MYDLKPQIMIAFITFASIVLLQAFIGFNQICIVAMIGLLFIILFGSKLAAMNKIIVFKEGVFIPEWSKKVSYLDIHKITLCLIEEGNSRGYELKIELNNYDRFVLNSINVKHYWELIDLASKSNVSIISENIPESEEKLLQLLDDWIEHGKGTYM